MRKSMSFPLTVLGLAAVFGFMACSSARADIAAGNGDGAGALSSFSYLDKAGGWNVEPPEGGYFLIYLDPNAGPWRKTLGAPNGGFVVNQSYKLSELLQVATDPSVPPLPSPPWTDYHESILTPGWMWIEDQSDPSLTWTFGTNQPGLVASHLIDAVGINADWTFAPAAAIDTTMMITKYVQYVGGAGADPFAPLVVAQYPTVPEPSTIVLLLVGAAAMLLYGWRRRNRATLLPALAVVLGAVLAAPVQAKPIETFTPAGQGDGAVRSVELHLRRDRREWLGG